MARLLRNTTEAMMSFQPQGRLICRDPKTRLAWRPNYSAPFLAGALAVFVAFVIVAAIPLPTQSDADSRHRYTQQEIRRAITIYAKRYQLDPALLRAVIKTESDFRQEAVSRKGAVGLMQLTPDTAATLRVVDIYDPIQNIRGGAKQLRRLLNRYHGNLRLTLAAYNAGIHRVRGGKVPPIRETRAYVRKVLRYYTAYSAPHHSSRSIPRLK